MKKNLFAKYLIYLIFFGLNLYSQDSELDNSPYNKKPLIASKELYEKDCNDKSILGCKILGDMYYFGEGVKQDYFKAKELYQKACKGKDFYACNNLGIMYEEEKILTKNYSKAKKLFEQACNGGNSEGCNNLGLIFENGRGVKQD